MILSQSTSLTPALVATDALALPIVATPGARPPRAVSVPGATLLCAPQSSPVQADAALRLLRGFRATGRRVVWFDATELAATPGSSVEQWGRRIVEQGGAQALIATGTDARRAAAAARSAGLAPSSATFAKDIATARNLLCDLIAAGDVALLLGVPEEHANKISERLDYRSSHGAAKFAPIETDHFEASSLV